MDSCMTCRYRPSCNKFVVYDSIIGCPTWKPEDNLNSQYEPSDNDEGGEAD